MNAIYAGDGLAVGRAVDERERFGVGVGPFALDGVAPPVGDVEAAVGRIGAGDEQEADPLCCEVGQPGAVVGVESIPAGARVRPVGLAPRDGLAVVVV
jgi:hypothetical protein